MNAYRSRDNYFKWPLKSDPEANRFRARCYL